MRPISIFPMSVLEQIGVCPKLHRIALIFIDPFLPKDYPFIKYNF